MLNTNRNAEFAAIVAAQAAIATATAGSFTGRNTTGRDFYGTRFRILPSYDGTQNSQVSGTPLARFTDPLGDNDVARASLVTVNLKVGNRTFFTQEVTAQALHDDYTGWHDFNSVLPLIATDQELSISYTNSSGVTIKLEAVMEGFTVPKGQPPFTA